MSDDIFYEQALAEAKEKRFVAALIARATAEGDGDKGKTLSRYIALRVAQLRYERERQNRQTSSSPAGSAPPAIAPDTGATREKEKPVSEESAARYSHRVALLRLFGGMVFLINIGLSLYYDLSPIVSCAMTFGFCILFEAFIIQPIVNKGKSLLPYREGLPAERIAPRPWSRFLAKIIDFGLYSLPPVIILSLLAMVSMAFFTPPEDPFVIILVLAIVVALLVQVIDGVVLYKTGSSIGRTVMNIEVIRPEQTSCWNTVKRNLKCFGQGMALGLPILPLVTMAYQHAVISGGTQTSWDRSTGHVVVYKKAKVDSWIISMLTLTGTIVLASMIVTAVYVQIFQRYGAKQYEGKIQAQQIISNEAANPSPAQSINERVEIAVREVIRQYPYLDQHQEWLQAAVIWRDFYIAQHRYDPAEAIMQAARTVDAYKNAGRGVCVPDEKKITASAAKQPVRCAPAGNY